ncbi:MAG: asparagine synthase (glutamine-hydrolyzing) [Candidatus Omnitrophica bacterium]|nr:asparagine synthase (glutamine-hydrolyzing) [Candidatus Omnitrophota bacterium]
MCGICGFVGTGDESVLVRMQDKLVHRGPDDKGHHYQAGLGLANLRLSIIDLEGGHQPIYNEDGKIFVVYNGEIYNFQSLQKRLEAKGHRFRSKTDTEVIVHAYEEWGDDCVKQFRGMFAFALWDGHQNRLFAARDRLGIKPFFYAAPGRNFIFASETKSLLEHPEVSATIDPLAFDLYMRLSFVPAPFTIFRQVKKLPPGHSLIWKDGVMKIRRYWQLAFEQTPMSEAAWLDALEEKIFETVRRHLISDVPLGAFLSGGTDSTAIVYAMSQCLREPVKTFSIGFEDPLHDERQYARQAAGLFKSDHQEFLVPRGIDAETFQKIFRHLDEPMSDTSVIPTYAVSKFARQRVPVVLTGDGADETFGGYFKYHTLKNWEDRWGKFPLTKGLMNTMGKFLSHTLPYGKRTLTALTKHSAERYAELTYAFYSFEFDVLYGDAFRDEIHTRRQEGDIWKSLTPLIKGEDILTSLQHLDILTYLPDDILVKVDRMSMLNSLEVRVPFLDHEFQELVAKIPPEIKWKPDRHKSILKKLLERWGFPLEMIDRKKIAFTPPLESYWLTNQWMKTAHEELISGKALRSGFLTRKGIDTIFKRGNRSKMWNLWIFETWGRPYF